MIKQFWTEWDFECQPFSDIFIKMKKWCANSDKNPQLWLGEHPLIVTKGSRAHQQTVTYWPSVETNRGGELTIHLPGQLVFYPLWDVLRVMTLPAYRFLLEQCVIATMSDLGLGPSIAGLHLKKDSPGVYTSQGKIASLGLRIYKYSVYHGISLNVACPLYPFSTIVCCGDPQLKMTNIYAFGVRPSMKKVKNLMKKNFYALLSEKIYYELYHSPS